MAGRGRGGSSAIAPLLAQEMTLSSPLCRARRVRGVDGRHFRPLDRSGREQTHRKRCPPSFFRLRREHPEQPPHPSPLFPWTRPQTEATLQPAHRDFEQGRRRPARPHQMPGTGSSSGVMSGSVRNAALYGRTGAFILPFRRWTRLAASQGTVQAPRTEKSSLRATATTSSKPCASRPRRADQFPMRGDQEVTRRPWTWTRM